tara:strand:+ start:7458 stop:7904 length:447 start_codon:yes stop_codon:yes gene_type:complete
MAIPTQFLNFLQPAQPLEKALKYLSMNEDLSEFNPDFGLQRAAHFLILPWHWHHICSAPAKEVYMIQNNKGQGLTEYIILVALLAVASLGIVRLLGKTMQTQLSNITHAVAGTGKEVKTENLRIDRDLYRKKDMGTFMQGASSENQSE